MALCSRCESIDLDRLLPNLAILDSSIGGLDGPDIFYRHHESFEALQASAETCPLCKILFYSLEHPEFGDAASKMIAYSRPSLEASERQKVKLRDGRLDTQIWLCAGETAFRDPNTPKRIATALIQCGYDGGSSQVSIFTAENDPAALCGDIIGRPVSPEPESEALFARIQGWLSECLLRHPECARDLEFSPPIGCLESPVALPTRVIDVGPIDSTPQPRLFESQGAQGVYIALSHCWGKLRILTTTTENYRRHQAGVEFFALSKTFRDAINITRRLGVRYLWIDSLCIIQDSRADWQTESSRMGSVYKNATLTIAAADAKDGSEGCFFPRQEPEIPAVQLLCRSTQGMYRMSVGLARGTFEGTASRSVLSTRGWVLQEKVLSRRILYFGREQVHFECQHHSVSEDGHCSPYHNSLKRSFDLRRYPGRENRNLKPPEWASNLHLFTRWGNLVREYSRRTLTQSTDKLVAISGLANEIGIRSGARYMVGLWMEGLHVGLGWRAVSENTLRKRAPPECNEPSWSWASVDGVIGYSTAKPFEIITSALRDVTYEAHRTGELELTGRCKSALYTAEYDDTEGRHLLGWEAYVSRVICGDKGAWAGKRLGIGLLDVGTHQETPTTCLLIYTEKKYRRPLDSTRHGVIFLERTAEPMVFRRIGAGTLDAAEWFDDCPEQAITLI